MAKKKGGKLFGGKPFRTGGAQSRREGTAGSPVGTKAKAPGRKKT